MNYVKHLSLALLVIGCSPVILAGKKGKKDESTSTSSSSSSTSSSSSSGTSSSDDSSSDDSSTSDDSSKSKKDKKSKKSKSKKGATVGDWTSPSGVWTKFKAQTTLNKGLIVGVPVAAAVAAYCFIPEVKKQVNKGWDKTKAFANDVIDPVENSNSRKYAIAGTAVVALGLAAYNKKALTDWWNGKDKKKKKKSKSKKGDDDSSSSSSSSDSSSSSSSDSSSESETKSAKAKREAKEAKAQREADARKKNKGGGNQGGNQGGNNRNIDLLGEENA